MYNIKIQSGGRWYDADLTSDMTFALTFEESDIADMSIKGSGSNEVELPRTPTNEKIFSYVGNERTDATPSFSSYPACVLNDGLQIMSGKLYLLGASRNAYSVAIVNDPCRFFDNLSAIDLTAEENERLFGTFRIGFGNLQGIEYGAGKTEQDANEFGRYIYTQSGVNLGSVIAKLTQRAGRIHNNLQEFDDIWVLPKGRTPIPWYRGATYLSETITDWTCKASLTFRKSDIVTESGYQVVKWKWGEVAGIEQAGLHIRFIIKNKRVSDLSPIGVLIRAYYAESMSSQWKLLALEGDDTSHPYSEFGFRQQGSDIVYDVCFYGGKAFSCGVDPEIRTILPGGINTTSFVVLNLSPEISDVVVEVLSEADVIGWGAECSFANNIGWKTGLDAYKVAYQLEGKVCKVGVSDVGGYNFETIKSNKTSARDWSEYLVNADVNFHPNFAQRNTIALQANSIDETKVTEYAIRISDDRLEANKEYIKIDAESPVNSYTCSYWTKEVDGEGVVTYKKNEPKAPYLYLRDQYRFIDALYLQQSYSSIESLISRNYRSVTASFALPVKEILQLDNSIPIYLRQFGAFFYVQKVSNWIEGKLCEAELIRL